VQSATAVAHPNVALIKYWGKRPGPGNLPATGSLSIVLGALSTTTRVEFDPALAADDVLLNDRRDPAAATRISACLDTLRSRAGVAARARVVTRNDFPTGAGLASSASGFAALVVAAAGALRVPVSPAELATLARMGSGSAPRSLYGGFALLQNDGADTRCEPVAGPGDWPLEVVIAVTTKDAKAVGSRAGMEESERTSPYYRAWVDTHPADLAAGLAAVRARDFGVLADLAEHSCLKMHAVMLTTRPPLIYWSPATLAAIHTVRSLRAAGLPVFFTIDAGPQLKAVCPPDATAAVSAALAATPGVVEVLRSPLGAAARLVGAAS
jgi:diphosphomevalonate decarboxylase